MKFEEALSHMRLGKKARHGRMKSGEYWICGYSHFPHCDKWPTLVKVFDNPFENERIRDANSWSWGIERWAIMCEDWEIVEDE